MSYVRANGRLSGRICGGGGRVCARTKWRISIGDAVDIGATGAGGAISGSPITALIAQLNRFAGRALSPPGGQPRVYVRAEIPLATVTITDAIATAALVIVIDRYQYAPLGTYSPTKAKWAMDGLAGDAVAFVTKNLEEIVATIARYGDQLSLAPAKVGITTTMTAAGLPVAPLAIAGGLLLAVLLVTRK